MSKQQSQVLEGSEICTPKRSRKVVRPWIVWYKWNRPPPPHRGWHRFGKYETKEIAEEVLQDQLRKWSSLNSFDYIILHKDEGKPA